MAGTGRCGWGNLKRKHSRMALEIERKFLVAADRIGPLRDGEEICQGFIATHDLSAVRVRLSGERAWLTIKGKNVGARRSDPLPACPPLIITEEQVDELAAKLSKGLDQTLAHVKGRGLMAA